MKVLSDGFLTSFFLRFVFQIRVEIRVYGKGGGFAGLNWGCSGKIFGASASYLGFSTLNVFPFFPFLFFFLQPMEMFSLLDFLTYPFLFGVIVEIFFIDYYKLYIMFVKIKV